MEKVITIIVTYNRKKLLEEAINSLLNQTYKNFDILIIDNASTDNTYEDVVKKYESNKVKYLNTGKNLGGAGGFNIGLKEAILQNYDFAWVMDDDSIPNEKALESIMNKKQKIGDEFSFISSLVKWTDNSFCKMNKVWFNNDEMLERYELMDKRVLPIKSASFVGCFINLKYAKVVGLPIKEFFIYADDVEYTIRLSKKVSAYLDIDSIIIHKMQDNVTSEINMVNENKIGRYFYDFRNCCYIQKQDGKIIGVIRSIRRYFQYFIKILKSSETKKMKRIWVITKGTICGLFFNPKIEKIEIK